MKRILINKNETHFIGSWNLENDELCKKVILFFQNNKNLHLQGMTSQGKNLEVKKRTDISIKGDDLKNEKFILLKEYINELNKCYLDYLEQWPFLKTMAGKMDIGPFNIGEYLPGDHFGHIHSERTSVNSLHRLFAFMTYLNDVEDGGHTKYHHFDISIKPEIGKTIIWPAEWTHAHTGEVLKSGKKYIITGWLHFPVE